MRRLRLPAAVLLAGVLLVLTAGPAATGAPVQAPEHEPAAVRYVVVLSFDGLRPDALRPVMPPALLARAAYTWQAKTTLPSVTLPSHTSMLTGVPPSVHQMLSNTWRTSQGHVQLPTAFSVVTQAGGRAAMFVTKPKLLYLARPGTVARAEYLPYPQYQQLETVRVAMRYLATVQPNLLFVHLADPDDAGHRHGWMSEPYLRVVRGAPEVIDVVLQTLERMLALERSLVIVTADHGGHGRAHGSDRPEDMLIPWLAFGAVEPGAIERPVMIYDTAATAVAALGYPVPTSWQGKAVLKTVRPRQ